MKIICLDSHVLVWGIKEQSTEGQEEMIPRTKRFIEGIDDDTSVLIPAIVIAEFLIPIPQESHAKVITEFNKNFIIAPFDALCASKFSLIWNTNKSLEREEQINSGITRAELKADSLIVATAVAYKAECIYSHDKWIKSFAKGFIEVKEIPFIEKQKDAFESIPKDADWGKLPQIDK